MGEPRLKNATSIFAALYFNISSIPSGMTVKNIQTIKWCKVLFYNTKSCFPWPMDGINFFLFSTGRDHGHQNGIINLCPTEWRAYCVHLCS